MRSFQRLFFLCLISLFFISCAGGSSNSNTDGLSHIGNLPKLLIKTANNGSLRADVEVYGPDGVQVYTEALQINATTGEVFSTQFKLDRGFTYTFIITFYYTEAGIPEIPIAFVAKVAATEESFLAVFWEKQEVLTDQGQLPPGLSASLSTSNLPDLDSDDDGFNNFAEIQEGSNPLDANDVPTPPVLVGWEQLHSEDFIEIRATFMDPSGVADIRPTGETCGFYDWTITSSDDDGIQKVLSAKFNLHAIILTKSTGVFPLRVQASDNLGRSDSYEFAADYTKNSTPIDPELNRPEILIIAPHAGTTASDFIQVEALACDDDGIFKFDITLDQGLGGFISNATEEEFPDKPYLLRITASLDTIALGDGPQNITFTATDEAAAQNKDSKSVNIVVENSNPIKIDTPQPGNTLQDGFTVAAHVDKTLMPDVNNLFIESIRSGEAGGNGQEIFALNQLKFDVNTLPEAFTGQIFDTSDVGLTTFTIVYKAVGTASGTRTREVTYTIDNLPRVEFDIFKNGPKLCLAGGTMVVEWEVENLNLNTNSDDSIDIDGAEQNSLIGFATLECRSLYQLTATRIIVDQNGNTKTITQEATIDVEVIDVPASPSDSITYNAHSFNLMNYSGAESLYWNAELYQIDANGQEFNIDSFSGIGENISIAKSQLDPRTDYGIRLELKTSPTSNNIISTHDMNLSVASPYLFTVSDADLIAWYRFDDGTDLGLDSSGEGNHANEFGVDYLDMDPGNQCMFRGCGDFGGFSSTLAKSNFPQTTSFDIGLYVYWDGSVSKGTLIHKEEQFSLGINGASQLEFIVWQNDMGAVIPREIQAAISGTLIPDNWHHINITYTNPSRTMALYVDGNFINGFTLTTGINQTNNALFIGSEGFTNHFSGKIDDVVIYNTVQ